MKQILLFVLLMTVFAGCAHGPLTHMKQCRAVPDSADSQEDFLCKKP